MGAIFLSASVPFGTRAAPYPEADPYLIQAAVRAFVITALGRRLIVWGGHPSITPMLWAAAQDLGVSYHHAVRLYQSRYFKDEFPEINQRFDNVTFTENIGGDREASLLDLRTRMFSSHPFEGAVFIGGMDGVEREFTLFRDRHADARIVLVDSCGGAAAALAREHRDLAENLVRPFDYSGLFARRLRIRPDEERRQVPN
jgi:hypothetical protein